MNIEDAELILIALMECEETRAYSDRELMAAELLHGRAILHNNTLYEIERDDSEKGPGAAIRIRFHKLTRQLNTSKLNEALAAFTHNPRWQQMEEQQREDAFQAIRDAKGEWATPQKK